MTDLPFHTTLIPRGGDNGSYLSERGKNALATSIVFTVLATCFVLARVYTRTKLMKRMEPNDWMILLSLALSYIFMGFFIVEALHGMGMHGALIPPDILVKQMQAFWATIPFYNAALLCAKATILMQYLRVFPTARMRRVCWIMMAILATYGTWAVLSAFLNCIPVAKFWNPELEGYCLNQKGLWFSNAAMHITTDLAILIIPLPALAVLELPGKQKVALMSIFTVGGFVCVTSICRLVALKKIADSSDPTYDNVGAASWSAVECNVGIICACLPTLRPLISRILPHLLSTVSGNGRPGYGVAGSQSQRQSPTYWNGMGTVSTTITHGDNVECSAITDLPRVLSLVPDHRLSGKGNAPKEVMEEMVELGSRGGTSGSSSRGPLIEKK